jgi:hypothetical protein
MVDDIFLVAMIAILAVAAVELRHGTNDGLTLIPIVQADVSIKSNTVPVSCASDETVEARFGYRTD